MTGSGFVPEHPEATLEDIRVVGGVLSLRYLHQASSMVEMRRTDGTFIRNLSLPDRGTSSNLIGDPEQDVAYYSLFFVCGAFAYLRNADQGWNASGILSTQGPRRF